MRGNPARERIRSLAGERLGDFRRHGGPGIFRSAARQHFLARYAIDALAGVVRDVPDVGNLGVVLLLRGDEIAAQSVVDRFVLVGRDLHPLHLHGAGEILLDLARDAVRRTDDRRQRDFRDGLLGHRRWRRRLGLRDGLAGRSENARAEITAQQRRAAARAASKRKAHQSQGDRK